MLLDDLDEPLVELLRYTDQRLPITEFRSQNPFKLPHSTDSFGFREQNKRELSAERERMRKMTLIQRTEALKPSIPPCITQKKRSRSIMSATNSSTKNLDDSSETTTSKSSFEKHQRTAEFIQQKREIYIVQMLIDKKNIEIQKINNLMKNEEIGIVDTEQKIDDESQKVKMKTTRCEAQLARARKRAENATRKRVELMKQFKQVSTNVAIMKSEIAKNEETLESYIKYHDYLSSFTPENRSMFEYFDNPNVLLDEIAEWEKKDLFLIKRCQYYNDHIVKAQGELNRQLAVTDEDLEALNSIIADYKQSTDNSLEATIEDRTEQNQALSIQLDTELKRITQLVNKTYGKCFKRESNISPVLMLAEIEANLLAYQNRLVNIVPSFVKEKQLVRDRERRDRQRREKQERQAIEQAKKTKQTLERANRPIKKKNGRPLVAKSRPVKVEKKDNVKLIRLKKEQQRLDELLYGSPFE